MRRFVVVLWGMLVAATALAGDGARLSFSGYGAVRVGMTRAQMETALGTRLMDEPIKESDTCYYVRPVSGPDRVAFMLSNGELVRIDVTVEGVAMDTGIHVGSSKSDVLAAYRGKVKVEPHAYTAPDGEYLTVLSPDQRYGVRFETDRDRVVSFYVGRADPIHYIEGCL